MLALRGLLYFGLLVLLVPAVPAALHQPSSRVLSQIGVQSLFQPDRAVQGEADGEMRVLELDREQIRSILLARLEVLRGEIAEARHQAAARRHD